VPAAVVEQSSSVQKSGVPLWDPAWRELFTHMGQVHDHIARAGTQNPLEFRAFAEAAVSIAAQPEAFDLDSDALEIACRLLH